MRILILTLLVVLSFQAASFSQSPDKLRQVAEESFATKDYYNAFRIYEALLTKYPAKRFTAAERLELKYQYARAAQRFNYLERADSTYLAVIEAARDTLQLKSLYALATFQRALTLQSMNNYQDALQQYETFVSESLHQHVSPRVEVQEQYQEAAQRGIESCEFALGQPIQPAEGLIKALPGQVNSSFSELAPVLVDTNLYFSSVKHLQKGLQFKRQSKTFSKVYRAVFPTPGNYDAAPYVELIPESGNYNIDGLHTVHAAITPDKEWMYYSGCELRGDSLACSLYRRHRQADGSWGDPQFLDINVDSREYSSSQPSIGYEEESGMLWLYFSSDRPGSVGGLDIWRSEIRNDSVLAPRNFSPVNTKWNEATPFYHSLTRQLYFSSDAGPGYGLYDIYYYPIEGGEGARIKSLPAPYYNTGYNDQYFFLTDEADRAFFTSDRLTENRFVDTISACCQDIYTYPIDNSMNIELAATGCGENLTANATFDIHDVTGGKNELIRSDEAVRYHSYRIDVAHPGYQDAETSMRLGSQYDGMDTAKDTILMMPEQLSLDIRLYDPDSGEELPAEEFRVYVNDDPGNYNEERGGFLVNPYQDVSILVRPSSDLYENMDTVLLASSLQALILDGFCRIPVELVPEIAPPPINRIIFYFDNDLPRRARPSPTNRERRYWPLTRETFEDTFEEYYAKKGTFLAYNLRPDTIALRTIRQSQIKIDGVDTLLVLENSTEVPVRIEGRNLITKVDELGVRRAVDNIFDTELRGGKEDLDDLCKYLEEYLKGGTRTMDLEVQGFCSARGNLIYNDSLANRRILCLLLSLETYNGGVLKQYIDYASLRSTLPARYVLSNLNPSISRPPGATLATLKLIPRPLGASTATKFYRNPNLNLDKDEGGIFSLPAVLDRRVVLQVSGTNRGIEFLGLESSSPEPIQNTGQ